MRIDKFLKTSRLIKRRTIAKEACETERVLINGKAAKPGSEVKVGDVVEIRFGNSVVKARVLELAETSRKEDAAKLYEML